MLVFTSLIAVIAIIVAIICVTTKIKVDEATKEENKNLAAKCIELKEEKDKLLKSVSSLSSQDSSLKSSISYEENRLADIQKTVLNTLNNQKDLSNQAFSNWWDSLERSYADKEKEYNILVENLNNSYAEKQLQLIAEADEIQKDLDKIRATRAAALEAQKKEKEIKEQLSFYCLNPSEAEKEDIQRLERLKPDLHNPRILSMLIWSTYFQKPMTVLCNNILGTSVVTGIYKITNQKTNECYIGQAQDISSRWKQHAKCGLGIDMPTNNKLYKAIQEYGIWNFSWELLEKCSSAELNEKERYYIELYQSYEYGMNSNRGISR